MNGPKYVYTGDLHGNIPAVFPQLTLETSQVRKQSVFVTCRKGSKEIQYQIY